MILIADVVSSNYVGIFIVKIQHSDIFMETIDGATIIIEYMAETYETESGPDGYGIIILPWSSIGRTVHITIYKAGYENATFTTIVTADGSISDDLPRLVPLDQSGDDPGNGNEPVFIILLIITLIIICIIALALIVVKMKGKEEEIPEE